MTQLNAPGKTTRPTVILSGPTRGLGRSFFDELISQAYPVVGLGRNLERISTVAKNASAPVELVEFDLGADSDALTDTLTVVRQILGSASIGPLVFISNASTIGPICQASGLVFAGL